jgi:competence protein ComEC
MKWTLSTTMLWCFAFVAGLEASVVRAVIMCMLMELGRVSGGKVLSLNTWGVAGFFMLLYNPFYLFDVGFQLSFVAVLSILMFYPLVNRMVSLEHRICRWGWGIVSVSVSAQLGTAPLVMYYFSNFSLYFLLANMVVSILVPLIIAMGFLVLLLARLGIVHDWMVKVLGGLVDGIRFTAMEISGWPWAKLSIAEVTPMEVVACYLLLWGIWRCWMHPSWKAWMGVLAGIAIFLTIRLCVLLGG